MSYPILRDDPNACMKCGFCMSTCPVYNMDQIEGHSARGRNMLILMARDNHIQLDGSYKSALYYCLLCGRCESVCPARLSSNLITLNARKELAERKGLTWLQRFIYRGLVKHRSFFARLGRLVSLIPGLSVGEGKSVRHFPDIISALLKGKSFPRFSVPFLSRRVKKTNSPSKDVKYRGEIAFFSGCLFEFFFPDAGKDLIESLTSSGFEVVFPDQTCCGLAVYSGGDFNTARSMAKFNIESFSEYDYIITGCASCGSTLKDYVNWFDDDSFKQKAYDFSNKIRDISVFLTGQNFKPQALYDKPVKVTYHDPCHLKWKQGISAEPREILKNIPGIEFIETEGDTCCGFGGSFGITHPDASIAIQSKKIEEIKKTGADIVVTSCPGCMIQLMDGIRRNKLQVKVMHINQVIQGKQ